MTDIDNDRQRTEEELIRVPSSSPETAFVFHRWEKLLLFLLSAISGVVDVISFLTLKIFAAHITGNLVLIAAALAFLLPKSARNGEAPRSEVLTGDRSAASST